MKSIKIDFAKFSSVRIGPVIDVEIVYENCEFDGVIIGGANNVLISDNPVKLGILDKKFDFLYLDGDILTIGAACKSGKIYNFSRKENIAGFEFVKNIPGTLGGMLTMNAGLMGYEISSNLISVKTNLGLFYKDELKFYYRKSEIPGIILEANFKISKKFNKKLNDEISAKRANQPKGASFGSCFTNPSGDYAGRLLEEVGLKGYKIGNAGFSEQHANFLINYGDAKFQDALALINLAQKRVFEKFGIELKTEVIIL